MIGQRPLCLGHGNEWDASDRATPSAVRHAIQTCHDCPLLTRCQTVPEAERPVEMVLGAQVTNYRGRWISWEDWSRSHARRRATGSAAAEPMHEPDRLGRSTGQFRIDLEGVLDAIGIGRSPESIAAQYGAATSIAQALKRSGRGDPSPFWVEAGRQRRRDAA